jgi:hypothetical protein
MQMRTVRYEPDNWTLRMFIRVEKIKRAAQRGYEKSTHGSGLSQIQLRHHLAFQMPT